MNIKLSFSILILFFFYFTQNFAQSNTEDYLKLEKTRIQKADSVEKDIKLFIKKNLNNIDLLNQKKEFFKSKLITHSCSKDSIISTNDRAESILLRKEKLRDLYFYNNPQSQSFFKAIETPKSLFISCVNGGFETGNVANYTFRSILANAIPIEHLEEGCNVLNNQGSFIPSLLNNQYLDRSTIVTSGNEPFLSGLGININKVHSGNYALKLNPNPIDATTLQIGNVTSVSRDFVIDGNTIDFSYLHFGYVVSNLTHIQPFFRYRIYSINSSGNITGVLKDNCISMDFLDCRYTHINDNRFGSFILAYTPNWVCERIDTSDLIGQNVRIEFTVSDCEFRGHFSTVYIDDLCGTSCPPTYGQINLDDINRFCPSSPFNVCGDYQLPNNGILTSISLNIINPSGNIINTITNPTISGQNFCFTVNPSIFGLNPSGTYSFDVICDYNISACGQTINDASGTITFSTIQNPIFTQVNPICNGDILNNLPTTSNNGVIGTWAPPLNNTSTTTYTFTPINNGCTNPVQMTIVVNQKITPIFLNFSTLCYGDSLFSLPLISNNNISGTWSPPLNNNQTTTYTFTPNAGECANVVSKVVEVYDDFNLNFDTFCQDGSFYVKVESINNSLNISSSNFEWSVNNINIASGQILNLTDYLYSSFNNQNLPINIKMIVTDVNNCSKEKIITINNVFCGIQKGISPNNDGSNDFFDLRLLNVKKLSIFNRYGLKVFSKDNYYNEWYGQTDNGKLLPDATYYYIIEFNYAEPKTGWIYINNSNN